MLHRSASIPLRLPPRQLCALVVNLTARSSEDYWQRPDLAIGPEDVKWTAAGVAVTVHNLGCGAARHVAVRLSEASGRQIGQQTVPRIDAPVDLMPRRHTLTFKGLSAAKGRRVAVHVDPDNAVAELNEENNRLIVSR